MVSRIDASRMTYDTLSKNWIARNGVKRIFLENGEQTTYFDTLRLRYLSFTPKELDTKQQKIEEMNFDELKNILRLKSKREMIRQILLLNIIQGIHFQWQVL